MVVVAVAAVAVGPWCLVRLCMNAGKEQGGRSGGEESRKGATSCQLIDIFLHRTTYRVGAIKSPLDTHTVDSLLQRYRNRKRSRDTFHVTFLYTNNNSTT